jgi:hypothetical protein
MSQLRAIILLVVLLLSACQGAPNPELKITPSQNPAPTAANQPDPTSKLPAPEASIPPTTTTTPTPSPTPTPILEPSPTVPTTTTLLFTGVIVPARCVQAKIDQLGDPDYPYEELREVINQADPAACALTCW